jgi:hypothetical protein
MKMHRLFQALLALILLACVSGVQGQFQAQNVTPSIAQSTAAPTNSQNPSQFSEFYTMVPEPASSDPIGAPQQFSIGGSTPTTLYFGEQMQSMPYPQYQSNPAYTGANSLWIKGSTNWAQYAAVPQGATVSLFAISPTGGSGTLTFVDSGGQTYSHNYYFYPNSLFTFKASTIGRNTLVFAINGQSSNQVVIDVVGNAPSYQYSMPAAQAATSMTALYRWSNYRRGSHFYTTDPSGELASYTGYTFEGITGYIATSQLPGTIALYRWSNSRNGDHFYTTNPSGELAPHRGYAYEGVLGYIWGSM